MQSRLTLGLPVTARKASRKESQRLLAQSSSMSRSEELLPWSMPNVLGSKKALVQVSSRVPSPAASCAAWWDDDACSELGGAPHPMAPTQQLVSAQALL
mmetsp:Transcript_76376/g.170879  ORF Transcript_76376/g.170879 Transcript_76376/m.170879 type:complete len:99 (-) Transcript_76376:30-326(-)